MPRTKDSKDISQNDKGISESRKAHLDDILDDALDETFPASDPISIDFEPPQPVTPSPKDSDT